MEDSKSEDKAAWSMSGDPCPACGGFRTSVLNQEGLTIHSIKPGSRYRTNKVVASPFTVLGCADCGYRDERRGFPDDDSLRARRSINSRGGRPFSPRRLGR